ncbi:Levodione reductase-like protein [Hapsidospora chrysogenum ATCC 11550]|uniref:Levodione reductase-like protein n=1 Tax=Hapsidospora chrysogenum (strain ATCC 11550 / CBS 779.69 / DSM 880 / IAM 14645 / JCM 23072 / IMI 49137) TaxID=857340 RepID=A0A086T7S9_HAPC1|nr:Levodione reductase-like protein [Hapsidospora chrysogenum ATCC 11550]
MSFTGKVIAITGGASGIGLATAKAVSERGGTVCIADRDPEAITRTDTYFKDKGVPYSITTVDVSVRDQVEAWTSGIIAQFGRLDGAANVAGVNQDNINRKANLVDLEDEEWHRVIGINLTGTMYCLRSQLRKISNGGSIVNMGSIHSVKGFSNNSAYDASKHGILGLTRAAAQENGGREVRVNCVAPGAIFTPLMQKAFEKMGRPVDAPFDEPTTIQRQGKAEEVAAVIVFLLGPESTFVSGACYSVDGGWS